ncbi:MAG: CHASE domain-containing protein [Alphaproteobacteria bacterium]|nr:CHASE domain-containing protein [Alphaproteobacteria bacterium]
MLGRVLPFIAAAISVLIILTGLIIIEHLDTARFIQSERSRILNLAGLLRARLESSINSTLWLAASLNTQIAVHNDIESEEFQAFARDMYARSPINFQIYLVKGSKIIDAFPRPENHNIINLDVTNMPKQREYFQQAMVSGHTVVSEPFEFQNNEKSIFSWMPVYVRGNGSNFQAQTYWGQIIINVKYSTLLAEINLSEAADQLNVAIRGVSIQGENTGIFIGDSRVFLENPVLTKINLPSGSWQMAAIPREGWPKTSPNKWFRRMMGSFIALVVGFLSFFLLSKQQSLKELVIELSNRDRELVQRDHYLAQRNLLLQVQQDASLDGILVIGPDRKVLSYNLRFVEIWRLDNKLLDNVPEEKIADIMKDQLINTELHPLYDLSFKRPVYEQADELILSDGRFLERYATSLIGSDNTDYGHVWFFRNITARKRTEAALAQARDEAIHERERAETANRAKSEFLALVSHELRTPLNAIIGFSEIISKELFGEILQKKYVSYALDIHNSGVHLLSLINDILDISKIEAKKMELFKEIIDVDKAAKSCLLLVEGLAREKDINLHYEEPKDVTTVYADLRAVKQMIVNLLSNSCKFTHSGGSVSLRFDKTADNWVVATVSDTGIGMSPEQIQTALEPFGQVENQLTRTQQGTGLGLPMVKLLIEQHGGRLEIDSNPDQGTTVHLYFPPQEI